MQAHRINKVLIVCAHRPGRSPSQRYRFEQYLKFLEDKGFEFSFSAFLNEQQDRIFYARGRYLSKALILLKSTIRRLRELSDLHKYDIIFIQREAHFLGTTFFEKHCFRSGARVIFDFDDSIWLADTSPGNKKWEWLKRPRKFFENASYAHLVIAGNAFLAERAREINVETIVIPTTIDTDVHVPMPALRNSGKIIIGWSGSISTVKHFALLLPVLERILRERPGEVFVKIMGAHPEFSTLPGLITTSWSEKSEVQELNTFDIGIMPLPDDAWARGKCGLKGLSYMACGIATVMSDVGVNREIIRNGENGFLASDEDDWYRCLTLLITDRQLREKTGISGRKTVEQLFSVAANREKYLQVFRQMAGAQETAGIK